MNNYCQKDEALQSIMSIYKLESSIFNYLKSVVTLLTAQVCNGRNPSVFTTAYTAIKQTNELQKIVNQKIEIYYDQYGMPDFNLDSNILKDFIFLYYDEFGNLIHCLKQIALDCPHTNWKCRQLMNEVDQASFLIQKRKCLIPSSIYEQFQAFELFNEN